MMSADAIIMNYITKYATSENGGVTDFTNAIIPKLPVIVFMVVVKKCIENSGDFFFSSWESFKSLMKRIFYTRTRIYDFQKPENKSYHLKSAFEKNMYSFANQYFPIEKTMETNDCLVVSHINWLPSHQTLIQKCEKESNELLETYMDASSQQKIIYKKLALKEGALKYEKSDPSQLYPSKNYLKLVDIIRDHFDVSNRIKSFSVLGASINGVPGLGKTKFADFAVNNKLAGSILKVDMTNMLKYSFTRVLNSMYHSVAILTDTIFVIDEIDKYLDYRMDIEYEDKLVEMRNVSKDGGVVTLDKDEFVRQQKNTFLFDILSILERDGLSHSIVVIFCSNNFQSIFEGVDMTHHESTFSRFMPIEFKMCDHQEIIDYLLHYNRIFEGTKFWIDLNKEDMSQRLKRDVQVTHRVLHHISIKSNYHALKIIQELNELKTSNVPSVLSNVLDTKSVPEVIKKEEVTKRLEIKNLIKKIDENKEAKDLDEVKELNDDYLDEVGEEFDFFVEKYLVVAQKDCFIDIEYLFSRFKDWAFAQEEYVSGTINIETFRNLLNYQNIKSTRDHVYGYKFKNIDLDDDELVSVCGDAKPDPLDHELVWKENYETVEKHPHEKEIVAKIREYLVKCENTSGKSEKALITANLFDYMAVEGYFICISPNFKQTVKEKVLAFYNDKEDRDIVFSKIKPSTKEFIYALTGLRY